MLRMLASWVPPLIAVAISSSLPSWPPGNRLIVT
jgi:hypothetical protein